MRLTAEEVETAFVDAARQQTGGPFEWERVAFLLNERLADNLVGRDGRPHQPFIAAAEPQR